MSLNKSYECLIRLIYNSAETLNFVDYYVFNWNTFFKQQELIHIL